MNFFIVIGIYKNGQILYISNTSPILWADNFKDAKTYDSFADAKLDLEDDFIKLAAWIPTTDINSIWIIEYRDNVEVGRERFI